MSRSLSPLPTTRSALSLVAAVMAFFCVFAPLTSEATTPTTSHSDSFYEQGLAQEPTPEQGGNGASVFATVPETPFNTKRSFLNTLPRQPLIDLTPEQRALATGAAISLSLSLFALYTWRLSARA